MTDSVVEILTQFNEESVAHLRNALEDVQSLRSDVISELGSTPNDLFLKCSFTAALDSIDESIRRALL